MVTLSASRAVILARSILRVSEVTVSAIISSIPVTLSTIILTVSTLADGEVIFPVTVAV